MVGCKVRLENGEVCGKRARWSSDSADGPFCGDHADKASMSHTYSSSSASCVSRSSSITATANLIAERRIPETIEENVRIIESIDRMLASTGFSDDMRERLLQNKIALGAQNDELVNARVQKIQRTATSPRACNEKPCTVVHFCVQWCTWNRLPNPLLFAKSKHVARILAAHIRFHCVWPRCTCPYQRRFSIRYDKATCEFCCSIDQHDMMHFISEEKVAKLNAGLAFLRAEIKMGLYKDRRPTVMYVTSHQKEPDRQRVLLSSGEASGGP